LFKAKNDAVLFVIRCDSDLFIKEVEAKESNFLKILSGIEDFLKSKIISNKDDSIGIIFYNTVQFIFNLMIIKRESNN